MLSKGISPLWARKAAINIILCNKDRLCIDSNSQIGILLTNFESDPNSLPSSEGPHIINILEQIAKKCDLKYFETAQYSSIIIEILKKDEEERQFFEQIKAKEAPLILLKRNSKEKPYAYFESGDGRVYLLTALFTQNKYNRLYCNFGNQWKNLCENPEVNPAIKFSEETVYVYTKINNEGFDKEKVNKILPSEFEGIKNEVQKLIKRTDANYTEVKIINKTKNTEGIEKGSKDQKNFKIEYEKSQREIENLNKELTAEKAKNAEISLELQKDIEFIQELKNNNQNSEDIIKEYKEQLKDSKYKQELLQAEINKLKNVIDENKNFETIIDILHEENKKFETENKALMQENQNYQKEIQNYQKENQNYQDQINKLISEIKRLTPPSSKPIIISYPLIFDKKKSGIPNIGNTCYLNSLLQVLASNNQFCEKIQTLEYGLFSTLSSLLLSIRNSGSNNTQQLITHFKYQLDIEFPLLRDFYQQDSKEAMVMLLDKLSELTYIDPLFTTSYHQVFNCHACNCNTKMSEPNIFIIVPSQKFPSIQEFLVDLKQPKDFSGDNQLHCEKCNMPQDITLEKEEITWPSTVIFYLPSNNGSTEINEELDIEGIKYRWYGLICHYAWGPRDGHYIAYTWDTKNWTEYNDSSAKNVSSDSVDVEHGYLAFYAREGDFK